MADKGTFVTKLSDILVEQRALSRDRAKDLQDAFGNSSVEEFDDFLLEEGFVNEVDLLEALSTYYDVPSHDLPSRVTNDDENDGFYSRFLLNKFPKDFLLRNEIIPLEVDENMLIVVAAEPDRPGLASAIKNFVSYEIEFYVGLRREIIDSVEEYYDPSLTEDAAEEDDDSDLDLEKRYEREALDTAYSDDDQEGNSDL